MARTPDISGGGISKLRDAIKRGGPMPFVDPEIEGAAQQVPGKNPVKVQEMPVSKMNPKLIRRLLGQG